MAASRVLLEQVVFKLFLGCGLKRAEWATLVRNWRRKLEVEPRPKNVLGNEFARCLPCILRSPRFSHISAPINATLMTLSDRLDGRDLEFLPDRGGESLGFGQVVVRDYDLFQAGLEGGSEFLMNPTDRAHLAQDGDLAGHGQIVTHWQALQSRNDPDYQGDARRWTFLGNPHKRRQDGRVESLPPCCCDPELTRSQTHRDVPAAVGGIDADSDQEAVHAVRAPVCLAERIKGCPSLESHRAAWRRAGEKKRHTPSTSQVELRSLHTAGCHRPTGR